MDARKKRFDKLLEPSHIGNVKIRNRIIKTAAETNYYNSTDYQVNETLKAFYEGQAKGGVGAVYVEGPAVDYPLGMFRDRGIRIDEDEYIPGLSELTEVIHKHDCPAFLQLVHAGPWHRKRFFGLQPIAASVPKGIQFPAEDLPRELSITEIEEIIDKFVSAAVRAEKAGFDGVDVNAGAAHLLSTFLSRHWNKRQDAYGCHDLESRARIVVEIILEIKKRLGQDFPVGVLFNGTEYSSSEALSIEESKGLAQIFEKAGADSLQIRSYKYGSFASFWPEQFFYPEPYETLPTELDWSRKGAGAYAPLAGAIKNVVSIPVITVGRLSPELGEKILREGKADFIGMCRNLFADPDLPNKIKEGRPEDIAPCTACLSCLAGIALHQPMRCRINASMGKEREFELKQAATRKKVLVVGGGPAGMEAARVAAIRGHEVILLTKEHELGGLLPTAALVKGLEIEDLVGFVRYFKTQLFKLDVKVQLGKEVDPSMVERIKPDTIVLAIGGSSTLPEIAGIDGRNVLSSSEIHKKLKKFQRLLGPRALGWLTKIWMPLGKRVIIIGGDMQGCEVAEFLVKRGRKVIIVDTAEEMGEGIIDRHKMRLFEWLPMKSVNILTQVKYEKITHDGLALITREGESKIIEADTIIPVAHTTANTEFVTSLNLNGMATEVYPIGDCREPGLIVDAVADGSRIGRTI